MKLNIKLEEKDIEHLKAVIKILNDGYIVCEKIACIKDVPDACEICPLYKAQEKIGDASDMIAKIIIDN